MNHLDPTDAQLDQDTDGLLAIEEYTLDECLDPLSYDTDGDGHDDNKEIQRGKDPCDPTDKPANLWWLLWLLLILIVLGVLGYFGYKYYPEIKAILVKKKPKVKLWPPFERIVGKPKVEKKPEKPKTTEEKLTELAKSEEPFEKLGKVTELKIEKKPEVKKAVKPKTTKEKLEELGKTSMAKLERLAKPRPKKVEPVKKKEKSVFDMLDEIGKATTRKDVFNALPKRKEDVFAALREIVKPQRVETISRHTAEKNIAELVKTFEKLKKEQGMKATINVFKTLLAQLLKTKKINVKDVEEVLLKLRDENIFTNKQVSDHLKNKAE